MGVSLYLEQVLHQVDQNIKQDNLIVIDLRKDERMLHV